MSSFFAALWSLKQPTVVDQATLLGSHGSKDSLDAFLANLFRYAVQAVEHMRTSPDFGPRLWAAIEQRANQLPPQALMQQALAGAQAGDLAKRKRFSLGLAPVSLHQLRPAFSAAVLELLAWIQAQSAGVPAAVQPRGSRPPKSSSQGSLAERRGPPPVAAADSGDEAFMFPSEASFRALVQLIGRAQRTLDVCVFNITDNDLANALLAAQRRGVAVRLISDDEQLKCKGSDVERLAAAGIPTRVDRDPVALVHHKFAVIDGSLVVNGSFNWTRSARTANRENIVVNHSPSVVRAFSSEFESMWASFVTVG